jgi:ribonucleoside-triphosphate reductase
MIDTGITFDEEFEELYEEMMSTEEGRELMALSGLSSEKLDVGHMSHKYFQENWADHTIEHNANSVNKSPINYSMEITKPTMKLIGMYLIHRYLRKEFGTDRADEIVARIIGGDYYVHDASGVGIQIPYCYAWSTHWLMSSGIPTGQLKSKSPQHAASFIGQVAEVVMEMSQEFAGAVAPADMIVAYAYYAERDDLSDKEIENHLQTFTHIVNRQFRTGAQSPFTNVSVFDRPNLENLFADMAYPDGSSINYEYVEHVQEVFLNWFAKGDGGIPYRFPIATINGTKDKNNNIVDKKFLKTIARCNTPLGCFNMHFAEGSKLAMCCRYINDPARMRQFGADSFGNGGLNIGSHRIVLLNIPRMALQAKGDWDKFYTLMDASMEDSRDILIVHRERILGKRIEQGFLKWFDAGVASLSKMFSTFGFTGLPEVLGAMGLDPYSDEGVEVGKGILRYMDKKAEQYSTETGYAFNIEEVPGESATINLADKDKVLFGSSAMDVEIYSNQFVSLTSDVSLTDRIHIEGQLMSAVSGGAITHINLDEKIENPEIMEKLITYVVSKGVTHFAINYGFTSCDDGHNSAGLHDKCPDCGSENVEHLTRVVGYFVPIKSWTKKRQEEDFPNRTNYKLGGEING